MENAPQSAGRFLFGYQFGVPMPLADVVDTAKDLGLPTLVGTIVGALLAHLSSRARGQEDHRRSRELLVEQDERRETLAVLAAVREIRNQVNSGTLPSYGLLHNEWQDRVLGPSRIIRDHELQSRARAGAYAIFLGTIATDQHAAYAVICGATDVEEWAEAWLRHDDPPPAHLPPMETMREIVRVGEGRIDLVPLNEYLADR